MPAELVPLALQENADAPIAVARVLRRQRLHCFDHRCVLDWQPQLVAERGAGDAEQPAGPALGQAAFASERNLLAPRLRAHHFRWLISFRTSMSRSRSASSFLSLAFSASSDLKRLTSLGASSPKCLRHA